MRKYDDSIAAILEPTELERVKCGSVCFGLGGGGAGSTGGQANDGGAGDGGMGDVGDDGGRGFGGVGIQGVNPTTTTGVHFGLTPNGAFDMSPSVSVSNGVDLGMFDAPTGIDVGGFLGGRNVGFDEDEVGWFAKAINTVLGVNPPAPSYLSAPQLTYNNTNKSAYNMGLTALSLMSTLAPNPVTSNPLAKLGMTYANQMVAGMPDQITAGQALDQGFDRATAQAESETETGFGEGEGGGSGPFGFTGVAAQTQQTPTHLLAQTLAQPSGSPTVQQLLQQYFGPQRLQPWMTGPQSTPIRLQGYRS